MTYAYSAKVRRCHFCTLSRQGYRDNAGKLYNDRLSNVPSATVSVTGEPLKKKSRKEQRRIEAAKGQAERLALMKLSTAIQVIDKKDHKIQKQIGLSIKFTSEVEFLAKKVLELKKAQSQRRR